MWEASIWEASTIGSRPTLNKHNHWINIELYKLAVDGTCAMINKTHQIISNNQNIMRASPGPNLYLDRPFGTYLGMFSSQVISPGIQ
jgi:hypothetical protein